MTSQITRGSQLPEQFHQTQVPQLLDLIETRGGIYIVKTFGILNLVSSILSIIFLSTNFLFYLLLTLLYPNIVAESYRKVNSPKKFYCGPS